MAVKSEEITKERLERWEKLLKAEDATPIIVIGVGHNKNSGKTVLLTVENLSNTDIRTLLTGVLSKL